MSAFRVPIRLSVALFGFGLGSPVSAAPPVHWRVVLLEPPGVYTSAAHSAANGTQSGYVWLNDGPVAPALWNANSRGWLNLLPPGAYGGLISGSDGNAQVGWVNSAGGVDAVLWRGTLESLVVLTPGSPYVDAEARAVAGDQQVGIAYGPTTNAALWYGSSASFVNLQPSSGVQKSEAFATDGERQGGWVKLSGNPPKNHAALWSGTAASFVDMNPPGGVDSVIQGMANGVQAGWARFNISDYHAIVWFGTPQSWLDLNPTIAADSQLYATTGEFHGGYYTVGVNGPGHATVWLSNDPDDFVDLHALLGPGWSSSAVYGLSEHEGLIYAAGSASRIGENEQAVLWIGRRPQLLAPLGQP